MTAGNPCNTAKALVVEFDGTQKANLGRSLYLMASARLDRCFAVGSGHEVDDFQGLVMFDD
jgi:hypothetical protein